MLYQDEDTSLSGECHCCASTRYAIQDSREFLDEIVKQLYSDEPLSRAKLEHCLEELCHKLDVEYPNGEIKVARYKRSTPVIEMWKEYNQEYLNQLAR